MVSEQSIYDAFLQILKNLNNENPEFQTILQQNILSEVNDDSQARIDIIENKVYSISEKILELNKARRAGRIDQSTYLAQVNDLGLEQDKLSEELVKLKETFNDRQLLNSRIKQITEVIGNLHYTEVFDEEIFRALIEKIVIKDKQAKFVFKCGIEIEVKL